MSNNTYNKKLFLTYSTKVARVMLTFPLILIIINKEKRMEKYRNGNV